MLVYRGGVGGYSGNEICFLEHPEHRKSLSLSLLVETVVRNGGRILGTGIACGQENDKKKR